jgi:dihydrofolate reductase
MRTVTYGAACSLDGFIARPDGGVDWLHYSNDVSRFMASYWPTVDTILMGRKTWEVAVANAPKGGGGDPGGGMRTVVFSRTLRPADVPGAELVSDDAAGFVAKLRREKGRNICLMGGGALAESLLAAGVVDEVGLNIHPILLGSGVRMFLNPQRDIRLRLTECRTMDGGCILATYRVTPSRARPKRAPGAA